MSLWQLLQFQVPSSVRKSRMSSPKPVTTASFQSMKEKSQKISMLTAYDYTMSALLDQAGVDVLLVGDSLGMVIQGQKTTIPVTLEEMIYHGKLVVRGAERAMVMVDLPFPHGQLGVMKTLEVAAKVLKETGCQSIKLEGGAEQAETIHALAAAGIPVMAHVGLRPQSVPPHRQWLELVRSARSRPNLR